MQVLSKPALFLFRNPHKKITGLLSFRLSLSFVIMKQSFQVLTSRLLDRELSTPPKKLRYKSAQAPTVQTVIKDGLNSVGSTSLYLPGIPLGLRQDQHCPVYNLVLFMAISGCRVSEALNLKASDITSLGHVKIKALKGSESRLVHSGQCMPFLMQCRKSGYIPWSEWSRQFVYREFKKLGIGGKFGSSSRFSVTHYFRHSVASSIKNANMDQVDTKRFLGHKSLKSTSHYHE